MTRFVVALVAGVALVVGLYAAVAMGRASLVGPSADALHASLVRQVDGGRGGRCTPSAARRSTDDARHFACRVRRRGHRGTLVTYRVRMLGRACWWAELSDIGTGRGRDLPQAPTGCTRRWDELPVGLLDGSRIASIDP